MIYAYWTNGTDILVLLSGLGVKEKAVQMTKEQKKP